MEKQHTPGPWTAVGNERVQVSAVYAGPRRRVFICEIWQWPDALLIGSAPDLLSSVVELLQVIEAHRIHGVKRITARARKAVASATGAAGPMNPSESQPL